MPIIDVVMVPSNGLVPVDGLKDCHRVVISCVEAGRRTGHHANECVLLHSKFVFFYHGSPSHEVEIVDQLLLPKFLQTIDGGLADLRAKGESH